MGTSPASNDVPPSRGTHRSRWPGVIGTIGIILGILIFIDQIDDLATLSWTEEDWRRVLGPHIAELVARALPSAGWRMFSAAVQMGLGILLFVASLALVRRRHSSIYLCRLWAWIAIAWALLSIGWAIWLLQRYAVDIPGVSPASFQAYAALGVGIALVLMLAFPLFMLGWFSRPDIRAEYETWSD